MDPEQLVARFPRLYHMAEDGSWDGIRRLGLLSTSALLDRFEVAGGRRFAIESSRRPEIVAIEHPEHGRALIRDNKPMQEKTLERCLSGMTPRGWYETLNRRVFFWVDHGRLVKLLGARAYRDRSHLVLTLDTEPLVRRHAAGITLSPINTGATFTMNPAPRGPDTFRPIEEHPADKPVVELTVAYSVPDVAEFVSSVERWQGAERVSRVWSRPG